MRALGLLCALLATSCTTDRCKKGTAFLSYALTGSAQAADTIDVTLTIGDGEARTMSAQRRGGATGSIEVDFVSYPSGQSLLFTLVARAGGVTLASSSQQTTAAPGCTSLSFTLDGAAADMAGAAASDDLLGSDASAGDLAMTGDLSEGIFDPSKLPSCTNLAANCGASGTDNCCTSPLVAGGMFDRSHDVASDGTYADTSAPATVSDFRLDKYEVTVGRFRKFVNAGMGTRANPPAAGAGANPYIAGSGWDPMWDASLTADTSTLIGAVQCSPTYQDWTNGGTLNEERPMNCISWYEAFAFCAWDGGFLPTEAEWNYAATAGGEQRAYPWSNPAGDITIDCSDGNYFINYPGGTYCVNGTTGATNNVGSESPKGDGKWGQSDLAGNVFEWNVDWYDTYVTPCGDCAALTTTTAINRVIRGGSFHDSAANARTARRNAFAPGNRSPYTGVRCARRPTPGP
jgi:sulfatase modifying factor 1